MNVNLDILQDIIRNAFTEHRNGNKYALLDDDGLPVKFFPSLDDLREDWAAPYFGGFFGDAEKEGEPVRGEDWAYSSEAALNIYDHILTPVKTGMLVITITRDDLDPGLVATCEALKTALFEASQP